MREEEINNIALMITVYVAALVWAMQHVADRLEKCRDHEGLSFGRNWLLHGEPEGPITEEYLIDTIKLLVSEGVSDGTQDDLVCLHAGFCLDMMSGKTIPQVEGE